MARYGYMAHDDPGPPVARTAAQRAADCGYPIGSVSWGENLAVGPPTARAAMASWLGSPGHRANIEHAGFRAIGVGAARDADGNVFWTQNFGSLADSGAAPPPAARPSPAATVAPALAAPRVKLTVVRVPLLRSAPEFAWTTSGGATSVRCTFDGRAVTPCASPLELHAGRGSHTLVVSVANAAGSAFARYSWSTGTTSAAARTADRLRH